MRTRRPTTLRLLACTAVAAVLAVAVPTASADCGQQVIDSYFNTGRIGYHAQDCYVQALGEVDADAKMYSGVMGAIRAARARDAAADARKAKGRTPGQSASGGSTSTTQPVDAKPPKRKTGARKHTAKQPSAATPAVSPGAVATGDARLSAGEAADVAAAAGSGPPLVVILLAAFGALLAVAGGAGLLVSRIGRRG